MKMPSIAGHSFDLNGRCILRISGTEQVCNKKFSDICAATKGDVGKNGWAHYGNLNDNELKEIEAERDRIWAAHRNVAHVVALEPKTAPEMDWGCG